MQIKELVDKLALSSHPVALGGCKAHKTTLECCEYNITIFDGQNKTDQIHQIDDNLVRIHHGKLDESDSDVLQKYENMVIISDDEWRLGIFLSNIRERKEKIRISTIKGCLVDALYYTTKAKHGLGTDPFTTVWLKCAAYLVCDALVLINSRMRSPTHMLEFIRKAEKNKINESFFVVAEIIGLERATPSLLERMVKSTMGFSDMIEANNHSALIQKKYKYLIDNSLLSDCYFYLGYVNKANVISISDSIHKRDDLIHLLKIALDLEHDQTKIEQQVKFLHKLVNDLSTSVQEYA